MSARIATLTFPSLHITKDPKFFFLSFNGVFSLVVNVFLDLKFKIYGLFLIVLDVSEAFGY